MKPQFKIVPTSQVISRKPKRLVVDRLRKDYLSIPIRVVYAKDLKRYVIADGHHRFFQRGNAGWMMVEVVGFITHTIYRRGKPTLKGRFLYG